MQWRHTDLLDVIPLSSADVEQVFAFAASCLEAEARQENPDPVLAGRRVALYSDEPTSLAMASFRAAAVRLGADPVAPAAQATDTKLRDAVAGLEAKAPAAVVARHGRSGAAAYLARKLACPVINAGDGWHADPAQALLDAFTLHREWGRFLGRTLLILGDSGHCGAARSAIRLFSRLGAKVRLCAPRTLLPSRADILPVTVYPDLDKAARGVDAVMCLRLAPERVAEGLIPDPREYAGRWGLGLRHLERARPGAKVLLSGFRDPGVEISSRLAAAAKDLVLDQAAAGVAVRMALLALPLTRKEPGHVR